MTCKRMKESIDTHRFLPPSECSPKSDVLIIGIGNELRGDDGLGLHVARELRKHGMQGTTIIESSGEGADLIQSWTGHDRVMLIDAFSSGSAPGLLHMFDTSIVSLPAHFFRYSSHAFGVAEAIEVARRVQILPNRMHVCGIEGRTFRLGARLSRPVRAKIAELIDGIVLKVQDLRFEQMRQGFSMIP